jgi:GNAT superfamily N-acetyltransferase
VESVRAATADDLDVLATLLRAFVDEQRELRGGAIWAAQEGATLADEGSLRAAIDDHAQLALLGALDGVVVGALVAHLEVLDGGLRLAVVRALFVELGAREVGVGSALLDAAIAWAAAQGCGGIDATVLPGSRGAKNFFEMHGMVARAIRVHRAVGEE